ncbi:GTPase [Naasia lichenicola]|uniref:ABC transporter n=1 Tax=Naasia lichenicola TaxID=2565933 RepID=A0A4S4FEG0_9MICO|nr:GTPase [Naasia lichenicola]THG28529.1 ABC transporter [Naasia lichenicola]
MSPARLGRGGSPNPNDDLAARLEALRSALASGERSLDPAAVTRARTLIAKVGERTSLSGEHTVVALAGATGSGKSSLFNALVGAEVSRTGARRPTTSRPTAAIWGDREAGPLLDWLGVDSRYLVGAASTSGPSLDGLILLDLPDFDSRELSNRVEAERVLELADMFVWVTDPQKYADARLHDDFVRILGEHEAVTLAVLNQEDRIPPGAVDRIADDLGRLLAQDGIRGAAVLPTSASTGAGLPELTRRLAESVAGHAASRRRLSADVITVARSLREQVGDSEADLELLSRDDLDSALGRAAGVPVVLDAVERDYRRQALAASGWPFTRWVARVRRDPLRRLRLGSAGTDRLGIDRDSPTGAKADRDDASVRLSRSSIPRSSSSARSAVDLAVRSFTRSASVGLPLDWVEEMEAAARSGDALPDALDQAVVRTSVTARRPIWWSVAGVLQGIFAAAAIAGGLWLLGLYLWGLLALPRPETPMMGVVPVPLLLVAAGLLLGIVTAGLARWWAKIGARRRRAVMAGRLRTSIAEVTDEEIVDPMAEVLARHRSTRENLARAGR